MEKAEVADFHEALRQHRLEAPPEKLHDVALGGAEAGTAYFPVGEGDRAVGACDKATVGDGDLEDRGGERGAGGGAVVIGLTVDVPGDRPGLRIDLLQQADLTHVFFEDGAGEGERAFTGTKKLAREDSQVVRSLERPPPGTM